MIKEKTANLQNKLINFIIIALFAIGTFFVIGGVFIGWSLIVIALIFWTYRFLKQEDMKLKNFLNIIYLKIKFPAFGLLLSFLLGGIIMYISGYNPIRSYGAMIYGGLIKNWHITILNSIPLIFTGLSIALAFKGGLFNIGAEGQYYIGAMVATWIGLRVNISPFIIIPVIFIAGFMGGALFNVIPAILKIKKGAHEVVTTMMLAYIAAILSSLFIKFNGGNPVTSKHAYITDTIFESAWLTKFDSIIPSANYRLHIGILLAIGLAILVQFFLYRTRLGFLIRVVGESPQTAKTQGISVPKIIVLTLCLAGGIAALAGVTQVLGLDHKMFENLNAGYGWNGIAVALLANTSPIGVIFTALLWGALDAGGQYMARTVQTPTSIVEIIKGLVLFLLLAKHLFTYLKKRRKV